MDDISQKQEAVEDAWKEIREKTKYLLEDRTKRYDEIMESFEFSQSEQAEAIRGQVEQEQEVTVVIAEFYNKLAEMIENASSDIKKLEEEYSKNHVG